MKKIGLVKRKKYVIYAKRFSTNDNKNYHQVRDHCYCTRKYRGTDIEELLMIFAIQDIKHQTKFL